MNRGGVYEDDDERIQDAAGNIKLLDRDYFRKNFSAFLPATNYLEYEFEHGDEVPCPQPHYYSLANLMIPFGYRNNPADGICMKFLKRGFTKPAKSIFGAAVWSADARWFVLGTQWGDLAIWEAEALKVHKIISIPAHKVLENDGETIREKIPVTAMAWKHYGNLLVTADNLGNIQYCDETFRNVYATMNAHKAAVRGLSFSPLDTKLASCGDDSQLCIWSIGQQHPDRIMTGHQSDIKWCDWHPYRSLIATASRDNTLKLWDPKIGGDALW
jgi:polyadenylation factor subunit 2